MSQRVKRPNRSDDGPVPTKRRKRPTAEEEEAASLAAWPRPLNDLKGIYNRTTTEAPAELFRKDLISAMKLPDSEPLASDEYWVIVDQWKQEWERGVQVPVNPDSLPEPSVTVSHCGGSVKAQHEFKQPKNKYIRITKDEQFKVEDHVLSSAAAKAEAACSYDLDECDAAWLKLVNGERAAAGLSPVSEDQLERVLERLELHCWDKIQSILRNEEGLGIEYDENVICDVCRSPDSEEGNEMVFCDSCNICVHQACYGITRIPEGQWLCCTCALSQRPECVLCPNKGGAMKCTRSGQKWAHVSCALWIPEVSIGCVEKMEPITKISSIPQSRWALICVLCRERVGACIQCSVKTCKTAYHVTCAFKHGLEMRAIIEDENADDGVKLRSYCEKHSKSSKKEKSICSGSEDDDSKRKKRKDMTSEEKNQARAARLQEIEAEFDKHVTVKDITMQVDVDNEALQYVYNYWKLKRKAGHNKPLLPPKSEDVDILSHKQEQADLEKMKMFVQLRQDLERVRNLCYMVSRREKLSRSFFRMREQTFHKQATVLSSGGYALSRPVLEAVIEANHGPSIYDRLYSHNESEDHTLDFDVVLARIAGVKSPPHLVSDEKKPELNGLLKDIKHNPYKKLYFNGSSKRRSASLYESSMSSVGSSDEHQKSSRENRIRSSSEDEKPPVSTFNKRKVGSVRKRNDSGKDIECHQKRFNVPAQTKVDSSSEEDIKPTEKEWRQYSRSRLRQMEHELGISGSDTDELMPIKSSQSVDSQKAQAISNIYSDSDSSDISMKNDKSNAGSDSHQNRLRTKAAVKEFSQKPSSSKSPNKSSPENKKKSKIAEMIKKDFETKVIRKKDYVPSDLIVPQRQAAKKASENMKSSVTPRVKEHSTEIEPKILSVEEKLKTKTKPKIVGKEISRESKKDKHGDVFDIDKEFDKEEGQEILAYVPQRQAAKKAAEHIKSGLGKPLPSDAAAELERSKKDNEPNKLKKEPSKESDIKTKKDSEHEQSAKIQESKRKSSSNTSTSSSSSSSTDSSSTSSSESEEASSKQPRSESRFSSPSHEPTKRTGAKDWPFLDKAAKSAATSSSSDSSDSSPSPTSKLPPAPQHSKTNSPSRQQEVQQQLASKSTRKKSVDKRTTPAVEREESVRSRGKGRSGRGRARTCHSSDRIRNVNVRSGNISNSQRSHVEGERAKYRKGKPDEMAGHINKENSKSFKLLSPIRKADKNMTDTIEPQLSKLEREILERKAERDSSIIKTTSTLDRLFSVRDKKHSQDKSKSEKLIKSHKSLLKQVSLSPVKENKEPTVEVKNNTVKKLSTKNKSIEDIFSGKLVAVENEPITENTTLKNKPSPKEKLHDIAKAVVSEDSFKNSDTTKLDKNVIKSVPLEESNDKKTNAKLSVTPLQNRSIFSPQLHGKDSDLLDFDNILDEGFGISKDEEITKGPLTFSFGNVPLFKEDSKEDSARETLNLVEKLRLELSKKSTTYDVDDSLSVASSTKNDSDRTDLNEQIVPNDVTTLASQKDEGKMDELPRISVEMRIDVTEASVKQFESSRSQEYRYTCDVPLEVDKNIEHNQLDHSSTAQADERWVPPSEGYSNIQTADSDSYNELNNLSQSEITEPYVQQYSDQQHSIHQQISVLPPQLELRVQEELQKNQSPAVQDRRILQTPFIDPTSMDCMPSPSPYADMHPQAKWAESEIMPNRRSSSSSAASSSSSCSRRNEVEDEITKRQEMMMMNHPGLEIAFGVFPQGIPPFPPNSLDAYPPFSEASQFVSPVSLFPPPNVNTQIPFPSPGAAMFPPAFGAPFPTPHSMIPPLPKPVDDSVHFSSACTAAFTSSQHNMALTAAMVTLPQPTPKEAALEDQPLTPQTPLQTPFPVVAEEIAASPVLSNSTPTVSQVQASPNPSIKSNSSAGKKSPSKPTRTSARFLSKSPNKSPGKSPRQDSISKVSGSGRGRGDNKRNKTGTNRFSQVQTRGRGRGRGRGRTNHLQQPDFDANTIHNKLVGTVYDLDFDDDISNENMADLRAMRERRKSVDLHDRKSDASHVSRDSSQSPKFASPPHSNKNKTYNTDLRDLRPPTPITKACPKVDSPVHTIAIVNENPAPFPDIVEPVLPGPVDMRTYSSNFEPPTYTEANLLGAFASGTADSQVHEDIDEDFEKELHSALTASTKKLEEQPAPETANIKVSLSDSRNQLKVKIKGPIANYTSTVAPLPPTTVDPIVVSNITVNSAANSVITSTSVAVNSGTSNLRRMRKKELLRQYWTQDMNMDEPTTNSAFTIQPAAPPLNRTIITIPKAVASMTTIPTRDDYRDYRTGADDILENKISRKDGKARPGALSRELRHLEVSLEDDGIPERRRSVGSTGSNTSLGLSSSFDTALAYKRRGRPPRPSLPTTPKLKIKISGNSIVGGSKVDERKDRIRPPKKRLATIAMPSVEDLKRESMKFRKLVMADFGEEKKRRKDKSGKRKKRKLKQELQIITNECENSTKLIIRIGKKTESEVENKRTSATDNISVSADSNILASQGKDCSKETIIPLLSSPRADADTISSGNVSALRKVRCNKLTPIKLKLSRCTEGSGYIMKTNQSSNIHITDECNVASPTGKSPLSLPEPIHAPTPFPLNKDCEVR